MSLTLKTERLILRRPSASDWEGAREFYMSERSSMAGGPLDEGKAWRQFAAIIGHWDIRGYGLWAVTEGEGKPAIGLVGPWHPIDWPETELGWVLMAEAEGKSIAFEAVIAARKDAFERLGWHTAVSYIDHDNTRSIALAERLGATLDETAAQPKPENPCLIFRHPTPEARP